MRSWKSTATSRLLLATLLAACEVGTHVARDPDADPEDDGTTDVVTDGGTDTDPPADTHAADTAPDDTGLALAFRVGWFEMPDHAFGEAEIGFAFYGLRAEDFVCQVVGSLAHEGDGPDCPGCAWAFDLGPVAGSVAAGDACGALDVGDGWADGFGDYVWGWGPYPYDDTSVETLLLWSERFGWYAYDAEVEIAGTSESLSWTRGVRAYDGGYAYYVY